MEHLFIRSFCLENLRDFKVVMQQIERIVATLDLLGPNFMVAVVYTLYSQSKSIFKTHFFLEWCFVSIEVCII